MKIFKYIKFLFLGRKAKSSRSIGRVYGDEYLVFHGEVVAGEMIYFEQGK